MEIFTVALYHIVPIVSDKPMEFVVLRLCQKFAFFLENTADLRSVDKHSLLKLFSVGPKEVLLFADSPLSLDP